VEQGIPTYTAATSQMKGQQGWATEAQADGLIQATEPGANAMVAGSGRRSSSRSG